MNNLNEYLNAFKDLEDKDKVQIIKDELKQTLNFSRDINKHYGIDDDLDEILNSNDDEYLDTIFLYVECIKESFSKYVNYNLDKEN